MNEKQQSISCEEIIEKLAAEFPTVQFLPGTVGFMVKRGNQGFAFPYAIFNDPEFPTIIINIVTTLEVS
jgi:hypothetical protein